MVLLTTLLLHVVGSQTSPLSGQVSSVVRRWSSEDLMLHKANNTSIQQVGLANKLNALICAPNVFPVSLHLVSAITGDHS